MSHVPPNSGFKPSKAPYKSRPRHVTYTNESCPTSHMSHVTVMMGQVFLFLFVRFLWFSLLHTLFLQFAYTHTHTNIQTHSHVRAETQSQTLPQT